MAEEQIKAVAVEQQEREEVEVTNRRCFDFNDKKEEDVKKGEYHQEEVLVTGVENIHIEEAEQVKEKKVSFLEKLHRTHSSSSSSSSDEDYEEFDVVKKKKSGLKEKIKEKLRSEKQDGELEVDEEIEEAVEVKQELVAEQHYLDIATMVVDGYDNEVKVEMIEENIKVEEAADQEKEKKGFLDKFKEKFHGQNEKQGDEAIAALPPEYADHGYKEHEAHSKEKKGILGKIMEKLPGYHRSGGEGKECEKIAS